MLEDALRDMAGFAARGRVGAARPAQPALQLEAPQRIVRGAVAHIAWSARHVREVQLLVTSPGHRGLQFQIPARGQRSLRDLPIGRTEIRLAAIPLRGRMGLVERQALVEVVHPQPTIELNAPHRVAYGEPLRIVWRVLDADHVQLLAPDGDRQVAHQGERDIPRLACGQHRFCIRAAGQGGQAERAISVQIVAPPVSFGLPAHVAVEQGGDVAIRYAVRGAARLSMKPLDRDEPAKAIPMSGVIHAEGVMESERLVLTAIGHDGRVRTSTTTLSVGPVPPPDISDFLEILQGRV